MATLYLTARDHNTLAWSVTGLSSSWNSSNFQRMVLASDSSGSGKNGSTTEPYGIVHTMYPPTSGSNNYTPSWEFSGLSPGSNYRFYAYSLAQSGKWYYANTQTVTMPNLPKPSAPTWVSAEPLTTQVSLDWSSVSGATNYELYCSNGSTIYTSNSYYYWNQLLPDTNYGFNVRAYANGQWSDWSGYIWRTTLKQRPANWSWYTTKTAGGSFNLTAAEWQAFINRIDAFRSYKDLYPYGFTNPTEGQPFYSYQFNQARTAISNMSPSVSLPGSVSSGDIITAYGLNRLRDSLNSIS